MSNFSDFFPPEDLSGVYAPLIHTHVVADITDIVVTTPADGHILVYAAGEWVNQAQPTSYPPAAHDHSTDQWFIDAMATKADTVHDHSGDAWFTGHTHTIAQVTNLQTELDGKEPSIAYGPAEYMAVANATSDGFNFVPQPDFEFYRLRGTCVPYTGATPNGFADTVGDNVVTELVADVAPAGVGDPSGVTYRCEVDLGSVVIAVGDAAVNVTEGDLLFWSGDSSKWLHIPQTVSNAVDSVNTKTGDLTIAATAGGFLAVTDGGTTTINIGIDPAKSANWDAAFGWGDHALAGYALTADLNIANWDTAFGWGDHSVAGYITDAPSNGNQYARKDGAWVIVEATQPALTYQLLATSTTLVDNVGYLCDSTAGALSLILPAGADNVKVEVLDSAGLAGTNSITILPNGADTIMGNIDFILNANYQGIELVKLGTDWKIIGVVGESVQPA